jgi:hypothetical protein
MMLTYSCIRQCILIRDIWDSHSDEIKIVVCDTMKSGKNMLVFGKIYHIHLQDRRLHRDILFIHLNIKETENYFRIID